MQYRKEQIMNNELTTSPSSEALAYIAGLFDGEGSVSYKQYMRKRKHGKKAYPTWQIRMEIAMTDESILHWVHEVLGTGTVHSRKVRPGRKKQWRWRCSHRQAYYVSRLLWPYVHVKFDKIQQIIKHYAEQTTDKNSAEIIDLDHYRFWTQSTGKAQ